VLPVNFNDPPLLFGALPDDLQSANNYLIALGQDLGAARGYDDATGVGAVTPAFVTSFTTGTGPITEVTPNSGTTTNR
jgi:hypothetical protein